MGEVPQGQGSTVVSHLWPKCGSVGTAEGIRCPGCHSRTPQHCGPAADVGFSQLWRRDTPGQVLAVGPR